MVWSQRARLQTETSPDWLQIYVYKLPAEFLQTLSAQWSADSLFEGNIKYGMHLGFSSPISHRNYEHLCCEEISYFIAFLHFVPKL